MYSIIMRRVADGKEMIWRRDLDPKNALAITKHMNHINDECARIIGRTTVKFVYFVRQLA